MVLQIQIEAKGKKLVGEIGAAESRFVEPGKESGFFGASREEHRQVFGKRGARRRAEKNGRKSDEAEEGRRREGHPISVRMARW